MTTILFAQSWDVIPGRFDEYSEFITNQYIPTAQKLGLDLLGGYYTAVGAGPRIMAVAAANGHRQLADILAEKEYRLVTDKLHQIVCQYSSRIWVASGRLKEGPYKIQSGAWKFNQYYNVIPGKEDDHYRFVKDECMPGMKELGVPITQGWRLVVGSGPRSLAECSGRTLEAIAKCIDSAEFRRLVRTLKKTLVTDYESRILAPTGRIEVPDMVSKMMKGF